MVRGEVRLHEAARQNDPESAKRLICEDKVDINCRNNLDRTALHVASAQGNIEVMDVLLHHKSDIEAQDRYGMRSLLWAALFGCKAAVQLLVANGCNTQVSNRQGMNILHCAAQNNHVAVMDFVFEALENVNPDEVDKNERTPLYVATAHGNLEATNRLLQVRANIHIKNKNGNTALHLAAENNHPRIVTVLIEHGCELNPQNWRDQIPLHLAVEKGHTMVVEALLKTGVNVDAKEKNGRSSLYIAARGSFVAIVDMLIKAERDSDAKLHDNNKPGWFPQEGVANNCLHNVDYTDVEAMQSILWKLATKHLHPHDWKQLAFHWNFTEEQIKAIAHQYTGNKSYKEHGYRMMLVWLHGVKPEDNPLKLIFEALVAIDRKEAAEHIRKKPNDQASGQQFECVPSLCCIL
ncbi:PREDICTED: ankyrin repeat and death domain-containing protein 1B-like [Priapulus caudatus]|uniref:Ankyrin repeat and death domain-containing protein 1B-like n=1 Tax=Priapulus caudatus TaxID=37621 RepID=A0ABM1E6Y9_PRICU|nr:PREDICTED: ankyrin repeat and death domain-containing protein 1B-like [Priapulus caudatus]